MRTRVFPSFGKTPVSLKLDGTQVARDQRTTLRRLPTAPGLSSFDMRASQTRRTFQPSNEQSGQSTCPMTSWPSPHSRKQRCEGVSRVMPLARLRRVDCALAVPPVWPLLARHSSRQHRADGVSSPGCSRAGPGRSELLSCSDRGPIWLDGQRVQRVVRGTTCFPEYVR